MLRNCSMRVSRATAAVRCTRRLLAGGALACLATATLGAAADNLGKAADAPFYSNTVGKAPSAAAMTDIGRALFFDASLSASGKMACATCHDPTRAFGPPNASPVQRGGRDGRHFGVRAVPSLMYGQNVPPFTEHYFDDDGDDSIDQGPAGGRTWDGRSQSAHDAGAPAAVLAVRDGQRQRR